MECHGWSVCISVCLTIAVCWSHWLALQKTVEPIEMLSGMVTWVGPRNHVLEGVKILALFRGSRSHRKA